MLNMTQQFKFTMTYAFFVVMGGLQASFDDIAWPGQEPPHHSISHKIYQCEPRRVITSEVLVRLAEYGVSLDIPRNRINDKSKANTIQKILVCVQVIWMAAQCLARRHYHLPLSLLEIHTMVHVIYTLSIYICWFQVGFDCRPEIPSTLTDPNFIRNHLMYRNQRSSLRTTHMIILHYSF